MSTPSTHDLEQRMKTLAEAVLRVLDRHFQAHSGARETPPGFNRLVESMRYSLLQDGAKRFRPVLAQMTAEALGHRSETVLPFAAALECVHTYSLVHDDLPAMDNDDFRRGQPTNHKKFDEATAILAGDALLSEAFQLIADAYVEQPAHGLKVVAELATAVGFRGMVGGQAIDMAAKKDAVTLDELKHMHALKTGALIRVSAVGAAHLCQASHAQLREIAAYAEALGLAFQVADDLLDFDPAKPEPGSYPTLLGLGKAKSVLQELTRAAHEALEAWPASADPLRAIADFNAHRLV